MLTIKNLNKSYFTNGKQKKVLDNISFKINPGEILGLLGPNGAGKSTIFNLITGLLKPDFGKVFFGSKDATNYPIYTRTREFKIGYVPQYGGFFGDLTTYQNLKAVAEILIKDTKDQNSRIEYLISKFELDYLRNIIVIAWSSIIFGIILYFADRKKNSTKKWEDLNFLEVIIIGFFQVLAFIPGASRAGVTITGARILNIKRESAAIFSMLLSIPIIIASLALSVIDIYTSNNSELNLIGPIVATIISFITALISIHFMMRILHYTNFNIFIIYRIILGITLLSIYA